MDGEEEQDGKKEEKKAFWAGLITLFCLMAVIVLAIFIVRGCSSKDQSTKEVENTGDKSQVNVSSTPLSTLTATEQGKVAGETAEPQPSGKSYTIESGDTLYVIGRKFKVDWRRIAEVNGIDNAAALKVGKTIIIPAE
jgi:nucleoid-associated protein YgaU